MSEISQKISRSVNKPQAISLVKKIRSCTCEYNDYILFIHGEIFIKVSPLKSASKYLSEDISRSIIPPGIVINPIQIRMSVVIFLKIYPVIDIYAAITFYTKGISLRYCRIIKHSIIPFQRFQICHDKWTPNP